MITQLSIGDVNEVEATLTITMTIHAWRRIKENLDGNDKLHSLNWQITQLLRAMDKHWESVADKEL